MKSRVDRVADLHSRDVLVPAEREESGQSATPTQSVQTICFSKICFLSRFLGMARDRMLYKYKSDHSPRLKTNIQDKSLDLATVTFKTCSAQTHVCAEQVLKVTVALTAPVHQQHKVMECFHSASVLFRCGRCDQFLQL